MPPYNPLAYQRPKALRKQARRDVRATSLPLVRQINREAAAGGRNIAGIASQLASQMGGYQGKLADIYSRAGQSLGALDTSQRAGLGQVAGGTLADRLRSQLSLSGLDGAGADALQGMTQGAAGAGFASGSAEVGALTQRQAAAEQWAAKLPELARLSGAQAAQERAARAQQDISRINASIPEQVQRLIEAGRNRNTQIGLANLAYQGDIFGEQQQTERTRLQQGGQNWRTRYQQSQQNWRTQQNIQATARQQGRSYNANLSRNAGYAVDNQGRPIINPRTSKPYPYVEPPSGSKKGKGKGKKTSLLD